MSRTVDGKGRKGGGSIVIRRAEVVEGGHHGGAWKVAYADFVTALMAFFLLMWLLNATTEEQKRGLADYFAPISAMGRATSGTGAPFGGHTPMDAGSLVSDRGAKTLDPGKSTAMVTPDDAEAEMSSQAVAPRLVDDTGDPSSAQLSQGGPAAAGSGPAGSGDGHAAAVSLKPPPKPQPETAQQHAAAVRAAQEREDREQAERAAFQQAAEQIRDAVRADPALAPFARQIAVDMTPEGLRIQLLDEDRQAMFPTGSSAPNDRARLLLQKIAPVLAKLREPVSVTGHTDAAPYRGGEKSNWDLSSERANATRRLLVDAGLQEARIRSVTGAADRDLLLPADPLAAANRRIAIMVLRSARPAAVPRAPS